MKRLDRRARAKTFSGLSSEVLKDALLQVPRTVDDGDSSNGGASSPETAPEPEQKVEQKEHRKQKKKKNRQPRIITSPPAECNIPEYDESRDTNGKKNYQSDGDIKSSGLTLGSRIEKSPSFRKRTKPESLDRMSRDLVENKENKRMSMRTESRTDRMIECNIVLLGDLGVGKTALAVRFVTRRYLHEYDPTLERTYEKVIQCSGEQVFVRLYDTVNKNWENYIEQADGFIVMYSVTSTQSQLNAVNIINSMRNSRNPLIKNIPILLAGNKSELEHARKVKREEPERIASENNCSFREVSIACTINVDSIIKSVVRQIQDQEGGRTTPVSMSEHTGHKLSTSSVSSLSRKPSNAKHKMKNFLKKKEKS